MKNPLTIMARKKTPPPPRARVSGYVRPPAHDKPPVPLPRAIRGELGRVARKRLAVQLTRGLALTLTVMPLLALAQTAADWFCNFSLTVRALLLAADALVVLWLLATQVLAPWRRRLDTHGAALLVERELPKFDTALVSAVELCASRELTASGAALTQQLAARVAADVQRERPAKKIVPVAPAKRQLRWLLAAVIVSGAAFWWFLPSSVSLLQRALLSNVPLPTKTRVEAVTKNLRVPAGADVELAARALGVLPKSARLLVVYGDGRRETLPVTPSSADAAVFAIRLQNVLQPLRYRFEINDGAGDEFRVDTRVAPVLAKTAFTQIFPAYTKLQPAEMSGGNLSLLNGGQLRVEAESSRPLKMAVLKIPSLSVTSTLTVSGTENRSLKFDLPVKADKLASFSVHLTDADGEESENDPVWRVDITPDRAPVVSLLQPKKDKITVLEKDSVPLVFSARDDYGFKKVAVTYQIFRKNEFGKLAAADSGSFPVEPPAGSLSFRQTFVWNLALLQPPLSIGDTVSLWVEAKDNNSVTPTEPSASRRVTLAVVSPEEKRDEFISALAGKADDLERVRGAAGKVGERIENTIRGTP